MKAANEEERHALVQQAQAEKEAMVKDYERRINELEERLAAEMRKMEDSNGYLKQMYEEKINNYENTIKSIQQKLD